MKYQVPINKKRVSSGFLQLQILMAHHKSTFINNGNGLVKDYFAGALKKKVKMQLGE